MTSITYRAGIKRLVTGILSAARIAAVALMICCAAPTWAVGGSSYRVELRLWTVPDKGAKDPIQVAQRRVFDTFCMKHPEILVRQLPRLTIQGPAEQIDIVSSLDIVTLAL